MKEQSTFRRYAGLFTLGYIGGTIYLLMYVRYCFYDQMIQALGCTNAQLGMLNTVCATVGLIWLIPGPYLADKLDAGKIILFTNAAIAAITLAYAFFAESYTAAMIAFIAMALVMFSYWSALIKYINGAFGDADTAGNAFGTYYLINGLSGAMGNLIPVYFSAHYGYKGVIFCYAAINIIGSILGFLFLDTEKTLKARGRSLKGDEPIQVKHILLVVKWPGAYIIGFAYLATYTVYAEVAYFTPYLTDVIGIDPDASSIYGVIRSYGAMVMAPVGGIMADKVFKSTSTWYIVAFAVIAVLFAIPLTFGPDSNTVFVCIYSCIPSIVIFALYAVTYSILRELHNPQMVAGTCIGLATGILAYPVDAVWPTLFGSWLDKYGNAGYDYIFYFLIADCVLGILVALWAKSHDKKCQSGKRVFRDFDGSVIPEFSTKQAEA